MGSGLSQATSQLKSMGSEAQSSASKVKQSGIGIGAGLSLITMNLVNTANQVIGLKRQYEDLTRKQNDVVQSDNQLLNKKNLLKTSYDKLQAAMKGTAGASKEEQEIAIRQFKLDMSKAKTTLDEMKARKKLNDVMNQGGKDLTKIAALTRTYENRQRNLANATIGNKETHQDLKRAVEDFYLSTIPTAIGVAGSFASVLQVVQKSGTGVIGMLGKLAIPFAAIAGVGLAIKTNFLGFRDFLSNLGRDIGNAVPAFKPLLDVLEAVGSMLGLTPKKLSLNKAIAELQKSFQPIIDTFKSVIDMIMKGNWEGAFKVVLDSAKKFWAALKKDVPILGDVADLVNKIQNGNWKGALLQIWKAAVDVWKTIKKAVPLLGDIETLVNAIKEGKWGVAFAAIKTAIEHSGVGQTIDKIFGSEKIDNFITRFTQIPEIIKANIGAKNKNPFAGLGIIDDIIQLDDWDAAPTIDGIIKALTKGFSEKDSLWGDDPNPPGKKILEDLFASANA